jgi:hypothetical protein
VNQDGGNQGSPPELRRARSSVQGRRGHDQPAEHCPLRPLRERRPGLVSLRVRGVGVQHVEGRNPGATAGYPRARRPRERWRRSSPMPTTARTGAGRRSRRPSPGFCRRTRREVIPREPPPTSTRTSPCRSSSTPAASAASRRDRTIRAVGTTSGLAYARSGEPTRALDAFERTAADPAAHEDAVHRLIDLGLQTGDHARVER